MTALIVGADKVETIRAEIFKVAGHLGLSGDADHWAGRKVGDSRREIPRDTRIELVRGYSVRTQPLGRVGSKARRARFGRAK